MSDCSYVSLANLDHKGEVLTQTKEEAVAAPVKGELTDD